MPPVPDAPPPAEYLIDAALVRQLLADQHPDLADLPLSPVGEGWDNAMFRLGDCLAVRLPRRAVSAPLILKEQQWLPRLARNVSLPIPTPCRTGKPAHGYPWDWSVVPWLKGSSADLAEPSKDQAAVFGTFLRSLHVATPADAPRSTLRGVPLIQRAPSVQVRMDRLNERAAAITSDVRQVWNEALEAPVDQPPTWVHGDLHPRNLLVDQGAITGVIDWGDLCAGDRATDLAAAWMLFAEVDTATGFWKAYGHVSEATVRRSKGWAFFFGIMLMDTGLPRDPGAAELGRRILARLDVGK